MYSRYSSMVRLNHRFRGPMESDKLNRINKAIEFDTLKAANALTDLRNRLAAFRQLSNYGSDTAHDGIVQLTQRLHVASLNLEFIKEGISNG
jgi:hypothetical protein